MALSKHPFIYKAVSRAIDAYGQANGITGRQHFAPLLGYQGENASTQLISILNYTSYNPATPKPLSIDHVCVLLDELGPHNRIIMDALARAAGGVFVTEAQAAASYDDVRDELLKISGMAGNLAQKFLEYKNNDGVIDDCEGNELTNISYQIRAELNALDRVINATKQRKREE